MEHYGELFIDGAWVEPTHTGRRELVDPTTEAAFATVATGGGVGDVDKAVAAARHAFESYSKTTVDERIELIDRIIEVYEKSVDEIADVMAREVGIPVSARAQATGPIGHMKVARDLLKTYRFETQLAEHDHPPRTDRCLRARLALELAGSNPGHQSDLWACRRMHRRPQAFGRISDQRDHAGSRVREGRRAQGRLQPCDRQGKRGGPSNVGSPGRGHDLVHRLDEGRHQGRRSGSPDRETRVLELGGKSAEHRS